MISPEKYMNIDMSVLVVGGLIIQSLKNCPIQKYEDIEGYVVSVKGEVVKPIIMYALGFLYLFGKISYQSKTDIVKLIES